MGALAPLFTCHPPSNTYQWCYNLRSRTTDNFKIYSPPLCNSWLMYTTINSATHHMHVPYLPSIRQDTANTAHTTTVTATAVLPCAQSNMSNQSANFTWGRFHCFLCSSVHSRQKTPCHNRLPAQQQMYTNQLFGKLLQFGSCTLIGCLLLQLCLPLPQQVLSVGGDLCRGHVNILCHLGSLLLGSSQLQRQYNNTAQE